MLTSAQMNMLKELLENQLVELGSKVDGRLTDLLNKSITAADPLDASAMDADRNFMIRIRDRESRLIQKISDALQRIEGGSYGECDECGDDIAVARLQARPVTAFCIRCKTKMESRENVGLALPVA